MSASFEKFILDAEMIQMLIETLTSLGISEQTLEYDANQEVRLAREQHMEKTAVDLPRATDGACHASRAQGIRGPPEERNRRQTTAEKFMN